MNVVREDPVRRGMLYAGTERGMYVSLDDGDHWQPLQLNLPTTSVRDIDVHGDDVVIATHGRAFWAIDNVTPLRQDVPAGDFLFKPAVAVRERPAGFTGSPMPKDEPMAPNPPFGAYIDYVIRSDVDAAGDDRDPRRERCARAPLQQRRRAAGDGPEAPRHRAGMVHDAVDGRRDAGHAPLRLAAALSRARRRRRTPRRWRRRSVRGRHLGAARQLQSRADGERPEVHAAADRRSRSARQSSRDRLRRTVRTRARSRADARVALRRTGEAGAFVKRTDITEALKHRATEISGTITGDEFTAPPPPESSLRFINQALAKLAERHRQRRRRADRRRPRKLGAAQTSRRCGAGGWAGVKGEAPVRR